MSCILNEWNQNLHGPAYVHGQTPQWFFCGSETHCLSQTKTAFLSYLRDSTQISFKWTKCTFLSILLYIKKFLLLLKNSTKLTFIKATSFNLFKFINDFDYETEVNRSSYRNVICFGFVRLPDIEIFAPAKSEQNVIRNSHPSVGDLSTVNPPCLDNTSLQCNLLLLCYKILCWSKMFTWLFLNYTSCFSWCLILLILCD